MMSNSSENNELSSLSAQELSDRIRELKNKTKYLQQQTYRCNIPFSDQIYPIINVTNQSELQHSPQVNLVQKMAYKKNIEKQLSHIDYLIQEINEEIWSRCYDAEDEEIQLYQDLVNHILYINRDEERPIYGSK